jgi:FAD/FMN-containing dehydrogenase/Fe-S oxidoreductase
MNRTPEKVAADLGKIVRGDVFADILHRAACSIDASIYRIVPLCIVCPADADDIVSAIRYAASNGIPVAARGAASGVAGESLCSGIVFDMTRYMNAVVSITDDGRTAVCQPGVVLDILNNRLAEYGRKIGPDPSSSNRATVGGCLANNATGAHWLQYGYIADYLEAVEVVLADGSLVELGNDFDPSQADDSAAASIAKSCLAVLSGKDQIIRKALPRTKRNRSGYNIAGICHDGKIDLARLLAGSEGTLAIFTKITLRTVQIQPEKALLQLEFDSFETMAQAVPVIVDTGASACELMDKTLTKMARDALPQYRDILPADAVATLLVEHTGETGRQVKELIEKTDSAVGNLASRRMVVFDPKLQLRLWKSRKDAAPLLDRSGGRKRAIPCIEDTSVDNHQLAHYISAMQDIAKRYELKLSFYGHAGDGELHIRPYLDLNDPAEQQKLKSVMNEVFNLAWSLGGSISGEHADGIIRASFIRRQYGGQPYDMMRQIKNIFDADCLLNPGKIITKRTDVTTENLKAEFKTAPEMVFENADLYFDKDELALEVEKCSGCGLCLSTEPALRMCPVFRALGEELAGSRAKANILRFWMTGQLDKKDFESPQFRKFLDLCINCRACLLQCPCGVDVSKLITAARCEHAARTGLGFCRQALAHNRYLSALGSLFYPVSNFIVARTAFKWLLEKAIGLDRRRNLPGFERHVFLKIGQNYLASCRPLENPAGKVAYFLDTYANYHDHELGFAVLDVLRRNNIEVILPPQLPAPLPAVSYGDIKTARRDLAFNVKHLAKAVRQGYKIVCSEPSAAICLQQELRHFIKSPDGRLVSENTYELMAYLLDLFRQGKLRNAVKPLTGNFVYHLPCHLSAAGGSASPELLTKLCNADIVELQAGCCGLAGTFGMQKKNYELSSKIAASLTDALNNCDRDCVITECSACKMQIEHISDKIVRHPIKILA